MFYCYITVLFEKYLVILLVTDFKKVEGTIFFSKMKY